MTDRRARIFAGVLFFALFAGEAIRNTLSWYGFAVVDGILAVLCGVILVRMRAGRDRGREQRSSSARSLIADPILPLTAFVLWCALSVIWSDYPGGTLLGVVVLGATTLGAVTIHRLLPPLGIAVALWWALSAIAASSVVFELIVAVLGRPILPVFPIDVVPGEKIPLAFYWSRAQLLEGGPIQGILGNSNLLGFAALLLLCVSLGLMRTQSLPRGAGVTGAVLALAVMLLARSSTVFVAALAVGAVVGVAALLRRRRIRALGVGASVLLLVGAGAGAAFSDRVVSALGRSSDLTGRTDIWSSVAALFLERPVAGWGWTGYWQPWIPLFDDLAERRGVVYLQAHNALLDTAFQVGIVGAVLLLWVLALVAWNAVRAARTTVLPLALIVALLVQSLTESRLLYEGNWALLVLLAAARLRVPPHASPTAAER